jgi:hypothetical protein
LEGLNKPNQGQGISSYGTRQERAGGCANGYGKTKTIVSQKEIQMTKLGKSVLAALVISVLFVGLSGCQKKEGPVERFGKQIDKAVEKAGQQIDKAGKKIEDTVKDANKK